MKKVITLILIVLSTLILTSCNLKPFYLDYTDQIESIVSIEILKETCDEDINCDISVLSVLTEEEDLLELLNGLSELEYKPFLFGDPITHFDVYGIRINYTNDTYRIIDEMCIVLRDSDQYILEMKYGYTDEECFLELLEDYIE